jgi:glutathione S-transferase
VNVVLWHIGVSHYSEKVRWALAYKGVEHERRQPMPSAHMVVALWLTRGQHLTFPVLRLDGETIADSTAIVGALERSVPEPALYPEDPAERRRALDLEDFFDEQLGPQIRQFAWHEISKEPELYAEILRDAMPAPLLRIPASDRVLSVSGKAFTGLRYRANNDALAEESQARVLAALDRLETELNGNEYLVGDEFSVADLTAAALFYPLVLPPEGPQDIKRPATGFEAFRAPLKKRDGYAWVAEMFRRHRKQAAASPVAPAHP